jgi:hypothetical protein
LTYEQVADDLSERRINDHGNEKEALAADIVDAFATDAFDLLKDVLTIHHLVMERDNQILQIFPSPRCGTL